MLTTLDLYSITEEKVIPFDVAATTETDEGGNEHSVIVASHGSEKYRFSPNSTDEELLLRAEEHNRLHA